MSDVSHYARTVVVGRNSKVWNALSTSPHFGDIKVCAIGHSQLEQFVFQPGDRVWIFAYSRSHAENVALFKMLSGHSSIDIAYISSASTNVTNITRCYTYPTAKLQAEEDVKRLCSARVVTIGLFYSALEELPGGRTAATSLNELAKFMKFGDMQDKTDVNLFRMVDRPFRSKAERLVYNFYGKLMSAAGRFPCLLRPVDFLLRMLNIRWYGYLYLSNRLWSTMI